MNIKNYFLQIYVYKPVLRSVLLIDSVINSVLFYIPLEYVLFIWKRDHFRWGPVKYRSALGTDGQKYVFKDYRKLTYRPAMTITLKSKHYENREYYFRKLCVCPWWTLPDLACPGCQKLRKSTFINWYYPRLL